MLSNPAGLPHQTLYSHPSLQQDHGGDTSQEATTVPLSRFQPRRCLPSAPLLLRWQHTLVILTTLTLRGGFFFLSLSPCVQPLLPPLLHLGCDCLSQASELSGAGLLFLCFVKLGETKRCEYSVGLSHAAGSCLPSLVGARSHLKHSCGASCHTHSGWFIFYLTLHCGKSNSSQTRHTHTQDWKSAQRHCCPTRDSDQLYKTYLLYLMPLGGAETRVPGGPLITEP